MGYYTDIQIFKDVGNALNLIKGNKIFITVCIIYDPHAEKIYV